MAIKEAVSAAPPYPILDCGDYRIVVGPALSNHDGTPRTAAQAVQDIREAFLSDAPLPTNLREFCAVPANEIDWLIRAVEVRCGCSAEEGMSAFYRAVPELDPDTYAQEWADEIVRRFCDEEAAPTLMTGYGAEQEALP